MEKAPVAVLATHNGHQHGNDKSLWSLGKSNSSSDNNSHNSRNRISMTNPPAGHSADPSTTKDSSTLLNNNNPSSTNTTNNNNNNRNDPQTWSRGGRQFTSPREIYTRSLYRICLKFTTSEDEDEGKPEPGTAYWTQYSKITTIGNGGPSSPSPDDICRRMDDSMSGPAAGILSRLWDGDGEQAALHALRAGMTNGWYIRGDKGDAAVRVGKAQIIPGGGAQNVSGGGDAGGLSKRFSFIIIGFRTMGIV